MGRLLAVLTVLGWAAFCAFGALALFPYPEATAAHVTSATVLAAGGGTLGLWGWFQLIRGDTTWRGPGAGTRADINEREMV